MYLVCDIEGTLMREDGEPVSLVASLVEAWLESGGRAVFLTTRHSDGLDATKAWLFSHLSALNELNADIITWPEATALEESVYKVWALRKISPISSAALVIDDSETVCRALRSAGYSTLRLGERNT